MTDLTIHDVPDGVHEAITARGRRRGQSAEAVVLELMHSVAREEQLMQELERASRAAETVQQRVAEVVAADAAPRPRRRYRRPEPTRGR